MAATNALIGRAAADHPAAEQLRRWFLKAVIFQDTLVGRDKSMRFVQYLARCLSGVTGYPPFVDILFALALSRKTLRFGRQLKWGGEIAKCWHYEKDSFDRATTLVELGSYWIYCCVDHLCFAQRVKLLRISAHSSDLLDRFAELFWLTEVVPVLLREHRAYRTGGGAEPGSAMWTARRDKAKLALLKAYCDLACSIYFIQPAAWRNRRVHKAWCGLLGAVTSAISIRANWPADKCLEG